jgi:phosphoribosylanthranilate isomerase
MKYPENIKQIADLKPNFMGFIFYPKSPRFAEPMDAELLKALPKSILKIGVFVNETLDNILEYVKKYNLNGVQLHGSESEELCYTFKSAGLLVLKAFPIAEAADFGITDDYEGSCDLFVFDTKTPAHGGSGQKFDWSILSAYEGNTPFLLSGGISPNDANEIKAISHPKLRGIDLNSRFETEPGRKDPEMLGAFLRKFKS